MHKKILNSNDTKQVAQVAIEKIAAPVKQTLGPGGNPIIIQRFGKMPDGTPLGPLVTKDGVSVAENVSFKDPALDTIAKAIIQVAQQTVNEGGDGTTTSVVLAEAIYKAGLKFVDQGENNIQLYNELQRITEEVIAEIDTERKFNIKSEEDIHNIAQISANGDKEIAKIVVEAILASGEDGYVALEESNTRDTYLGS